jgi:hypothetical protein
VFSLRWIFKNAGAGRGEQGAGCFQTDANLFLFNTDFVPLGLFKIGRPFYPGLHPRLMMAPRWGWIDYFCHGHHKQNSSSLGLKSCFKKTPANLLRWPGFQEKLF